MSQQYVFSAHAQHSLLKLLIKLGLLNADSQWAGSEYFPIAHFSKAGAFKESDAIATIAKHLDIPIFEVTPDKFQDLVSLLEDPKLKAIETAGWKTWRAMPIAMDDNTISVAFANPFDHEARSNIGFTLGRSVIPYVAAEDQINSVLGKQLNLSESFKLENIILAAGAADQPQHSRPTAHESTVFGDDVESAPVIRLANKILSESVERGASDIHLEPQKEGLQVRVRVDGIMQDLMTVPAQLQNSVISRLKILCGLDIAEHRRPQDGRLRIKTAFGTKDLRMSTVPSVYGETLVARILSSDLSNLTYDALGMPQEIRTRFQRALLGSSRVILVTGPTGSGKTSSLYTGLLSLADGERTLVTIEDPIEYRLGGVTQIQVNPKVGLTFADGLRSIVRQDPDVVMVGEIRDQETANIAMQTAQTGHLVLSTFHTNNAAASVTRLRDLGVPSYVIASSLGCIVAQRLVRKLCSCCAPADDATRQRLTAVNRAHEGVKKAVGCEKCAHSGFSGRTGVYSIIEINDAIREAIRTDQGEVEIERLARNNGFESLAEAGLTLVEKGVTSLEELERVLGPLEQQLPVHNFIATPTQSHGMARRKVLLVEDDENTRSVLSMLLQNEFFDVVEAEDGLDGLEKLFQSPPDLVVLDLMMPRMDGAQMLKKMRADPRTSAVPVLMLTAAATEENELNLIDKGADDFVNKTSDSRILLARVQRLIARAPAH